MISRFSTMNYVTPIIAPIPIRKLPISDKFIELKLREKSIIEDKIDLIKLNTKFILNELNNIKNLGFNTISTFSIDIHILDLSKLKSLFKTILTDFKKIYFLKHWNEYELLNLFNLLKYYLFDLVYEIEIIRENIDLIKSNFYNVHELHHLYKYITSISENLNYFITNFKKKFLNYNFKNLPLESNTVQDIFL